MIDFDTFAKKLPKNVGRFGKLIVAKGFKNSRKSNKSPNLVTLVITYLRLGQLGRHHLGILEYLLKCLLLLRSHIC